MSHTLLVSSRAQTDLTAAHAWYEQRLPGLGNDFIRRIDATLQLVQRSPNLFRPRHGTFRMAMTTRFPFAIYFIWDEAAGHISVRRILHFAQNSGPTLQT